VNESEWYAERMEDFARQGGIDPPSNNRPKIDHAWFNRHFDEVDPGWRERKRLARAEADMLWANQGITYLSPEHREGIFSLGVGLFSLR
jgi:hypothetical protein